ncbi:hypothetical protein ANME2D_00696 [Candidatus Methanoperedens nitroreducens]|uniref:Uncharacterized protein n=1 Tax=Candidatus Methanoperedens nitratireducens TaxID=1392998 RepID=A0A062VEJ9_9EURY|nr:hypothetical protein [Candidatus Methanoperedens nitroreducens]KCZ73625.1 hypothetical protein ANME2D_00696 [Candidatus Methanoperedens nitroreducens]MDJ1422418.1 hypothetical protein [Candidatus Methanoperedens sp.]
MITLPSDEKIHGIFKECCEKLDIDSSRKNMEELVIYDMTDGTRTSTELDGSEAYFDGGLFVMRFIHFLRVLGAKNSYINVIHEGHKERVNYSDIYEGMRRHVEMYREYSRKNNVRLRFVGKYDSSIGPKDADYDLREDLRSLEEITAISAEHTVHFLINYSTRWAAYEGKEFFKTLPEANVILRHAKGYVNGDMWLYGKLDSNSFVYAQNGSSNINWSDRQIIMLIALCLRSMLLNKGTHLSKKYEGNEKDIVRKKREIELSFIHRSFYDRSIETKLQKRVIIFSSYGPEIYEF